MNEDIKKSNICFNCVSWDETTEEYGACLLDCSKENIVFTGWNGYCERYKRNE